LSLALDQNADYVFWINHDDYLEKGSLQRLFEFASNNPDSIVCSAFRDERLEGSKFLCGYKIRYTRWFIQPMIADIKALENPNYFCECDVNGGHGVLIPRKLIELKALRPKLFPHYAGDFDFFMRARKLGYKTFVIGKAFVRNDATSSGILGGGRIQRWNQIPSFLFSRRSVNNLRDRPLFALLHLPIGLNLLWGTILFLSPIYSSVFFFWRKNKRTI
jgi:GT2 family glycosyltransferase